ncbi:tRNA (guanine-N(1)-)-methyltransferase [Streptomyces hirsutus]
MRRPSSSSPRPWPGCCPDVLGNAESHRDDSFAPGAMANLLEGPVHTKPPVWRGRGIPEVLLSGHHGKIARWRRDEALRRTSRPLPAPDLIERGGREAGPVLRHAGTGHRQRGALEESDPPGQRPVHDAVRLSAPGAPWVMGAPVQLRRLPCPPGPDYGGTVSEEEVVGRAMVIAWPFGHWNTLDEPTAYAAVSARRQGDRCRPAVA